MNRTTALLNDLRARLANARREGVDFEDAWQQIVVEVIDEHIAQYEWESWLEVLNATKDAWRDSYEQRDTRLRAFASLDD